MKKLLIIAMACYGLSARAQVRESRNFLYLYSDSTVHADDIKLRRDFSGILKVRVDSRSVPIGQIKFLSSNDGFFANTRKIENIGTGEFAERIIEGKVNVFQVRPLSNRSSIYDIHHTHETHSMPAPSWSLNRNMYYNLGYADLKRWNYTNLNKDLADNPQSMDMLHAYKKSRKTTTLLYIAGAASFVGGVFVLGMEEKRAFSNTNMTIGMSVAGLGAGLITGGYLKSVANQRKLEAAIDSYNR
jgi:hypothetical protein